jgi:hypothetical protein
MNRILSSGIIKHLVSWLVQAYGAVEIDAHFQHVIPNHHVRIFSEGITNLSWVTGKEHSLICCVLLGIVADISLPHGFNSVCLLCAVCAILDFLYLAQLPVITMRHLTLMKIALDTFHNNKCYDALPLSPRPNSWTIIHLILLLICFVAMPLPHTIFTLLHVSSFPSAVCSCQCIVDVLFVALFIVVPS